MNKPKNKYTEDYLLKRAVLVAMCFVALVAAISSCGFQEDKATERGRGDTEVSHINQGKTDLSVEMGDGFLNVGQKCFGVTAYFSTAKGDGNAGSMSEPKFMDPFCLGVYAEDGSVNDNQLKLYVEYTAALNTGNGEQAASLAAELIANAPQDLIDTDGTLR